MSATRLLGTLVSATTWNCLVDADQESNLKISILNHFSLNRLHNLF